MILLPVEQMRFYVDTPETTQIAKVEMTLSFEPDTGLLEQAVKEALVFFPRFGGRAFSTEDGKGVILERNDEAPPVSTDETPKALGTKETNHYLFRVVSTGNRLILTAFHALGDGLIYASFLIHIVYFYLKSTGRKLNGDGYILTEEDMKRPDLFENVLDRLRDVEAVPADVKTVTGENVFYDPKDEELYGKKEYYSMKLLWDTGTFHALTKKLETTPLILVHVLLSECIRELNDVGDKIIETGFAVDLHGRLGSRSQCEYGVSIAIHYPPEYEGLSFEEKLVRSKEEFDKRLELPALKHELSIIEHESENVLQYLNLNNPDQIRAILKKKGRSGSSLFISNLGKSHLPEELKDDILSVFAHGSPTRYEGNYYMYNWKGKGALLYIGNSTDHTLMERFREKLFALAVDTELEITGLQVNDYLGRIGRKE